MLQRILATTMLGLTLAVEAVAGPIAVVDFQKAVTETDEGKAAQSKIDNMYKSKKSEIEKMQTTLEQEIKDFQSRSMVLSDQARGEAEQGLMMKQRQFEQTYMQYQQEMQQTYVAMLQELDTKMRAVASEVAKEKSYDVVLDAAVVVYQGPNVVDMTNDLVAKYNAAH